MTQCGDSSMREQGLIQNSDGSSNLTSSLQLDRKNYQVIPIDYRDTYSWLKNKHYAKSIPNIMQAFGLYNSLKELQGVCCFGTPANNHNNHLGSFRMIELVRLVVNEGLEKNICSFFISKCLKQLEKPLAIISYADEGFGHHGFIYQATNWIYTGLGGGVDFYRDKNNRMIHSRIMSDLRLKHPSKTRNEIANELNWKLEQGTFKHRYFYFIGNDKQKQEMRKELFMKYKSLSYPKGDNKRYDASFQPEIQQILF